LYEFNNPGADSQYMTVGTVTVCTHVDGIPGLQDDSTGTFYNAKRECVGYSPMDNNGKSMMRLIAGGFEVHNDTPSLTKGGNVCVYSMPNDHIKRQVVVRGSLANGLGTTSVMRTPPTSPTEAALLGDARNWEAAEGCYVPIRLHLEDDTSFHPYETDILSMRYNDEPLALSGTWFSTALSATFDTEEPSKAYASYNDIPWRKAPIETTGAYFSGLDETTVLTLDLRFIVEIAPTHANTAMVSMASPSAPYDPKALACYTNCQMSLPPGVPVRFNDKGKWWQMVLKAVNAIDTIATPLALASGQPELAAITNAVNSGLKGIEALKNSSTNKKNDSRYQSPNNQLRKRK